MKKFLGYMFIFAACCWLYNYCSNRSDSDEGEIVKQVTVSAKVANLRTGPGTNYDVITVNADGTGGKLQVQNGTILDVIKEQKGWYQVRFGDDERTAYIKKTLCTDVETSSVSESGKRRGRGSTVHSSKSKGSKSRSGSSSSSSRGSSGSSASETATPAAAPPPSVSPDEEEVVEITTGRSSQDEVIY